ncbi:MAG: carbohydrate kinase [Deltaproteobacteria bacterium]|nr:carbohydrate kinase [Deltaproteobacteria bacterium]MBT4639568.1 carbohydrate kinase [Deltaproteobacteria bacterium]MBT6504953.1 carbohydrate kinase [Deltaproteobacteria bacterium]MBT7153288.1 carbohydrate kinase [Deltaproteobacteria bacterium]MBT7711388.1 carbohydrate kinase [Deltaproteobacteria bacterium]
MESILTIDVGSTSMRAIHHDSKGEVLHKCRRGMIPDYRNDTSVELDGHQFLAGLLSLLKESYAYANEKSLDVLAISVTSQRSSVAPVNAQGEPLMPFITWHDKRTVPLCKELQPYEEKVYRVTGLRISPVLSAVKMAWLRKEQPEVYKKTAKMLGFQDVVIYKLCGQFVTDHSLASNTNLLNLQSCEWDPEMLDIFSVKRSHLCDLVPPGSVCGGTTNDLQNLTGIPENTPVVSAGGDQQCSALGVGIMSEGKLKCTTGTGSYLIAHTDSPMIDEQRRFLCKVGAIPGTYNLEAGMLTTGTVYRWFLEQFYGEGGDSPEVDVINREVLSSPPGANGVILLPHFEGSGAPHWNPNDNGIFYRMKLSTTRADMARAVLEGIVMEMGENISLFKEKFGQISKVYVSGGMTKFSAYNQLQSDIYGVNVVLNSNRESTSLGAWISAAVTCGLYATYEEAFQATQSPESETQFSPDYEMKRFYQSLNSERKRLYQAIQSMEMDQHKGSYKNNLA